MRLPHRLFRRVRAVRTILVALLLPLLGPLVHAAGPSVATEPQVKALFVLNFMKFVEWPASAFADPTDPLVVGVAGENTFSGLLEDAFRNEHVRGRPLIVRRLAAGDNLSTCHVLVIGQVGRDRLPQLLSAAQHAPSLTISEGERFCEQGGIIRLLNERGSVRFEVNPTAASAAGLKISSKLLQLARAVVPATPSPRPR